MRDMGRGHTACRIGTILLRSRETRGQRPLMRVPVHTAFLPTISCINHVSSILTISILQMKAVFSSEMPETISATTCCQNLEGKTIPMKILNIVFITLYYYCCSLTV
jgi:hypothetical protein